MTTSLWDRVFPASLSGKSVLEVGCGRGQAVIEAGRRGATRVVGIDVDIRSVRSARARAATAGVTADFRVSDIETDEIVERFDYVVCVEDLEYARDPLHTIGRMARLARERLVLRLRPLDRVARNELSVTRLAASFIKRVPAILIGRNRVSDGAAYHLTTSAVEILLLHHHGAFSRVVTSVIEPNAALIVADKWRIGRLVVLAGPSAAGKSTLMEKLARGEAEELARRLGIEDPRQWTYVRAAKLRDLPDVAIDRLVLHYDIMRPYMRRTRSYGRDSALDILDTADEVIFATMWSAPETLRSRMRKRLQDAGPTAIRTRQLADAYDAPGGPASFYEDWFRHSEKWHGRHFVIEDTDVIRVRPLTEWAITAQQNAGQSSQVVDAVLGK